MGSSTASIPPEPCGRGSEEVSKPGIQGTDCILALARSQPCFECTAEEVASWLKTANSQLLDTQTEAMLQSASPDEAEGGAESQKLLGLIESLNAMIAANRQRLRLMSESKAQAAALDESKQRVAELTVQIARVEREAAAALEASGKQAEEEVRVAMEMADAYTSEAVSSALTAATEEWEQQLRGATEERDHALEALGEQCNRVDSLMEQLKQAEAKAQAAGTYSSEVTVSALRSASHGCLGEEGRGEV